jgi:hypothetical protein
MPERTDLLARDDVAERLRGLGPLGLVAMLGYVRPTSWLRTIALGAAFGVLLKLERKVAELLVRS